MSLWLIHNPLFPDQQGSFKDPRPVTPILWAVLLRLSLRSVFVCHTRRPMVGNTTYSIGPKVRIEENRLLVVRFKFERGESDPCYLLKDKAIASKQILTTDV